VYYSCRGEGGRGGSEGGLDVSGPFGLIFGDSVCVPFLVVFVQVEHAAEIVRGVGVTAVPAFGVMGAFRNDTVVLLSLFATAFGEQVVVFFFVATVAFRASIMV
jgi:hypothetical protein